MRKTRSRRRSSRRKQIAARWRFVAGFTLFSLALAAAILFVGRPPRQAAVAADANLSQAADALDSPAAVPDRAVYPFSIIESGAQSADELKRAIAGDPVVAAHYANFDLKNTRVVRLEQSKVAHVSYRIGRAVYWTRKPLVIAAGETVLTDGVHVARTRCANQLADEPGQTSPAEPAAAVLDTPVKVASLTRSFSPGTQPVVVASTPTSGTAIGSSGPMSAGSLASLSPTAAAGAVGSGIQADGPRSPVPSSDDSTGGAPYAPGHPGGSPGIPPNFPVPAGGSTPPVDGPPNTPDQPTWLPPEILLPPGGPELPPGPLDPSDPGDPGDDGDVATIPEPGITILMLGGALAYVARRIRRKS
jgi:hypothetical protein